MNARENEPKFRWSVRENISKYHPEKGEFKSKQANNQSLINYSRPEKVCVNQENMNSSQDTRKLSTKSSFAILF